MDQLDKFSVFESNCDDMEDSLNETSDISSNDINMALPNDLDSEVKILVTAFCNYYDNVTEQNIHIESATCPLLENMLRDNNVAQQFISGLAYLQNKPLLLQYFLENVTEFVKIVWRISLKSSVPADIANICTESDTISDVIAAVNVTAADSVAENEVTSSFEPAYNMGKEQIVILIEDFIQHLEESAQSNQFEIPITPELQENCNDDEVISLIIREIPYLKDKPTLSAFFQDHVETFVKILSGARDVEDLIAQENKKLKKDNEKVTQEEHYAHVEDIETTNPAMNKVNVHQTIHNIEFALELLSSIGFTNREENLEILKTSGSVSMAAIRLCEIHQNAFSKPN